MKDCSLLVGNDINNIVPGREWEDMLDDIIGHFNVGLLDKENKPFPMLYEEIFLKAVARRPAIKEIEVKGYIADIVGGFLPNEIHARIRNLGIGDILTTNYDFTLEGVSGLGNVGLINETNYSVFRKCVVDETAYWHVHGDWQNAQSINLGYEHYCGQLQAMRNYAVSGTNYRGDRVPKKGLITRLVNGEEPGWHSWIDLFFKKDVHILGLKLDFVEVDLWWLLTYRARLKLYKSRSEHKKKKLLIENTIYYYVPAHLVNQSIAKLELLEANDVRIVPVPHPDKLSYYQGVLDRISAAG